MGIIAEAVKHGLHRILDRGPADAITLLEKQHRDAEVLFALVEKSSGRDRSRLFNELADALALHARIEELIFYPATRTVETAPMLLEAVEEHLSFKRLLADMIGGTFDAETFSAKLKVLKELIEHHVKEEERELFPAIRASMSSERLMELGLQLEAMTAELQEQEPRRSVASETVAPARI